MKITWTARLTDALRHLARMSNVAATAAGFCAAGWCFASNDHAFGQTSSLTHNGATYTVVPASQSAGLLNFASGDEAKTDVAAPELPLASALANGGLAPADTLSQVGASDIEQVAYGRYSGVTSDGFTSGMCGECPKCIPYCYGIIEALYMRVEDFDERTLSAQYRLDEPDFEPALRVTVGQVPDCINGIEASFTGLFQWETSRSLAINDGLNPRLTVLDGSLPAIVTLEAFGLDTDPLNPPAVTNADFHNQRREAEFWSAEVSRTMIAWDVAKFLIGGRFINYEDDFQFGSENEGVTGFLSSNTLNRMVGAQVGLDVFNPTSRYCSTYFRGRAGVFLNLAEKELFLVNNNATIIEQAANEEDLAGMIELGSGVRFALGEMLTVRAGTELWYMTEIANATQQFSSEISPAFGSGINNRDEILFIGFTVGAELKF
ncbi:MAG: hypothetical protein AAF539_15655 [Planctomycetota bacterium]